MNRFLRIIWALAFNRIVSSAPSHSVILTVPWLFRVDESQLVWTFVWTPRWKINEGESAGQGRRGPTGSCLPLRVGTRGMRPDVIELLLIRAQGIDQAWRLLAA